MNLRDGLWPAQAGATTATWVAARADAEALRRLLPAGFELSDPLLTVEAISLTSLPWLAGRGYGMLLVSVPVTYHGSEEHTGRLELVTWEDSPDAIMTGREELGWNKLYADTMVRQLIVGGKRVRYTAAWGGTQFFRLAVGPERRVPQVGSWRNGLLMHYRVFPRAGAPGETEVEQVTAASAGAPLTSMRSLRSGSGSFEFRPAAFEELPTLHHIVNRLAQIELGEVVDAGQAKSAAWGDVRDIRVISG